MASVTFQDPGSFGDQDASRRQSVFFGLALLVSLAIHAGMILLMPDKSNEGVAEFGRGGTVVSLGPAGREAGGEVAEAASETAAVEDVRASETQSVEAYEPAADVEAVELTMQEAPDAELVPDVELQVAAEPAFEIAPSSAPDSLVPETQEAATVTAQLVTPPLPKRRPIQRKSQSIAEQEKAVLQEGTAPRESQIIEESVKPRVQSTTPNKSADDGQDVTRSENEVAGGGGRSGQSGLSEIGQGDNTPGGGTPGADNDYYRQVQAWLDKHKRYPRRSKLRNEQGVVMLHFVVTRDGSVSVFGVKESSGYQRLDKEALGMIERALPLPAMPAEIGLAKLDLVIPVRFELR